MRTNVFRPTEMRRLFFWQAFTLVELLICMAVISVLVVAMAVVINPHKMKGRARDASRKSGIAQITGALSSYQMQTDSYPERLSDLVPGELISLLKDPKGGDFSYLAQSQDGGSCTTEARNCLNASLYSDYEFPNNICVSGTSYWGWTSSSERTGKICTASEPTYADTPIDD